MRWFLILASAVASTLLAVGTVGGTSLAAAPTVAVVQNAKLGPILVGPNGDTLYRYTKDSAGVSNCSGGCATVWPPLTVSAAPTAGAGVSGTLGTIKRAGGTLQVTYNGWPLYYYAADQKPGDTNGQGIINAWYALSPTVAAAPAAAAPVSSATASANAAAPGASATAPASSTATATASGAAAATISVAQNAQLGPMLVGPNGDTLYRFLKDSAGVSNCSGKCATIWPPLTVSTAPVAGAGVTGTLGTIRRTDGTLQVTYNGWPLYYYAADQKPGETNGQGIIKAWYVVAPTIAAATPAAPVLPKTGSGPGPEIAGLALVVAGAGLLLARRRRAA